MHLLTYLLKLGKTDGDWKKRTVDVPEDVETGDRPDSRRWSWRKRWRRAARWLRRASNARNARARK